MRDKLENRSLVPSNAVLRHSCHPYFYLWLPLPYMECILLFSFTNKTFPCPYLTITPGYKGKHAYVCASSDVSVFVRACGGDVQKSFWLSVTWIL